MSLQERYIHGFITKCAQVGVSPSTLLVSNNPTGVVKIADETFTPAQMEAMIRIIADRSAEDRLAEERRKNSPVRLLGGAVRRGMGAVRKGVSAVNGATQKGFEKLMSKYPWMAGM